MASDNNASDIVESGMCVALKSAAPGTDAEDLKKLYDQWASKFNQDVLDGVKYVGHLSLCEIVEEFTRSLNRGEVKVMDVGAGTGLVGKGVADLKFKSIDAFDLSPEMLKEASKLNIYSNLIQGDLYKDLNIEPHSYDLIICAATFTLGHVTAYCIPNLLKILKRGGLFIFTVRNDIIEDPELRNHYGFPDYVKTMEKDGLLKLVDQRDTMPYHLTVDPNFKSRATCTIFVCEKL